MEQFEPFNPERSDKMEKEKEAGGFSERPELQEVLDGQEVAELESKLFKVAPEYLQPHLLESNVVLVLAGFKPQSEFFISLKSKADLPKVKGGLEKLNRALEQQGTLARFEAIGQPFSPQHKPEELDAIISIESLVGYERMSHSTAIPGVPEFDSRAGWEEFEKWYPGFVNGVEQAQKQGKLPAEYDTAAVLSGLNKGYPDQAIYDFARWLASNKEPRLQESAIPYTGLYQEAEPNFDFFPEHADDPTIQSYIKQAGQLLKEFYESAWHQQIAGQPHIRANLKSKTHDA